MWTKSDCLFLIHSLCVDRTNEISTKVLFKLGYIINVYGHFSYSRQWNVRFDRLSIKSRISTQVSYRKKRKRRRRNREKKKRKKLHWFVSHLFAIRFDISAAFIAKCLVRQNDEIIKIAGFFTKLVKRKKNNIAFIIWTNRGQANETNKTSVKKVMLIIYERNEINYTHTHTQKVLRRSADCFAPSLSHIIDNIFLHAHDSISWRTFLLFFFSHFIYRVFFFSHSDRRTQIILFFCS